MTKEDIDRIATEYLNDTESEFEMQDVIELADKALILEKAIENIKAEIIEERKGYPPSADYYKAINKVLQIINKHTGDTHEVNH